MNIFNKLYSSFLRPRGTVSRYTDSLLIIIASCANIFEYYLIEYQLCVSDNCKSLEITKYWHETSVVYILSGICLFAIGVFIFNEKNLPLIYSLAIFIAVAVSAVFSGMIIFAMSKELANIT
jgi:uncharacterized membrane protein YiaA